MRILVELYNNGDYLTKVFLKQRIFKGEILEVESDDLEHDRYKVVEVIHEVKDEVNNDHKIKLELSPEN